MLKEETVNSRKQSTVNQSIVSEIFHMKWQSENQSNVDSRGHLSIPGEKTTQSGNMCQYRERMDQMQCLKGPKVYGKVQSVSADKYI